MSNSVHDDPKPDGAAFDDFFESLGKKAEHLTNAEHNGHQESPVDSNNNVAQPEREDDQKVVDEIESLCMNCHENGITRLLLTRIPFFREVILMSFFCPHCNFKNSEIQAAGEIQQKGSRYELRLTTQSDFARQVVKSDTCIVKFIELDVEVPAGRGQLTNVEGLLSMILEDLEMQQPERKVQHPEIWAKIEEIVVRGRKMIAGESFPFRLSLDDPAGNSWIEPDQKDGVGKWSKVEYARTAEQNEALGIGEGDGQAHAPAAAGQPTAANFENEDIIPNEVYSFPATCPGCRDILKSESCALECPELNLSVNPGTLGGRFTTVEGLLTQVRDDLHQQIFDVGDDAGAGGDSLPSEAKQNWAKFFDGINEAIKGERKFTVVLTDPLASSYVQNLCSPDDDPQIETEEYERTAEEEEDLGLTDMKTEGYVDEVGNEKKRLDDEKKLAKVTDDR
ncbi:zinc finger protein [Hyphodiscus hymeniophilus]|uniref:Zinc finger protein n=1 Tax=Hyphodiscus hymeniophilus TaxID=353542 RepID=A0A9P6VDZ7_9HELO|nr:zinc finger protein [Hyphodiscus hymeniophilus]